MPRVSTSESGPYPLAPRVVAVEALTGKTVRVAFEDGEVRDVSLALDKKVFRALREPERFAEVSVVEGGRRHRVVERRRPVCRPTVLRAGHGVGRPVLTPLRARLAARLSQQAGWTWPTR